MSSLGKLAVFSERLKKVVELSGLSQVVFADSVNIKPATLSHYLLGRTEPSFTILVGICTKHNVSTDYLMGLTDNLTAPGEDAGRAGIPQTEIQEKIVALENAVRRVEEEQERQRKRVDKLQRKKKDEALKTPARSLDN